MKKTLLMLTFGISVSLLACGGNEPTKKEAGKDAESPKTENAKDTTAQKETDKKDMSKKEADTKGPDKPQEKKVDDDLTEK